MSGGVKQGEVGENKLFSRFVRRYLENSIDTTKVTTNDY